MSACALIGKWTPLLALAVTCGACGGAQPAAPSAATAPLATAATAPTTNAATPDPLGPRPDVAMSPAWKPPTPTVYTTPSGMTVWLLERHTVPLVAVTLVVPTGASSDPKGQAGLAFATTNMLDEGAGKLGAIDLARAIDQLGAKLRTGCTADMSFAQLTTLKRHFAPAMGLLGDVVVRPRFDAVEWKRVRDLWLNDLRQRASEPEQVASVVASVALFGPEHPYGHPVDGFVSSASNVALPDVKKFYAQAFRPDRATVVVVGDATKAELDKELEQAFGGWKKPETAPLPIVAPPAIDAGDKDRAKAILVDREDAPQSVIAFIRPGTRAGDAEAPPLERANIALGGSFTSRLNQDMREEHGWTYGVHSRVATTRGVGSISARAAVITDKTGEALKAMLADIDEFAKNGLTDDETAKTRVQARADLVEEYQSAESASLALARNAALALPADFEAKAASLRDDADRAALGKLAARFFDRSSALVVVVGPKAKLTEALTKAGIPQPELRDAEGAPSKPKVK